GGIPIVVETTMETGFKMTPEQLKENLSDRTKLLIYSSPCNPSGAVYSDQELSSLAKVLRDHPDILVISDEIYELINYGKGHASMAAQEGMFDRTITINGLSKGFAMTGYRLGYMAGPADLIRACDTLQGQFTSGSNSITQIAAITAMKAEVSQLSYMIDAFHRRRDLALSLLKEIEGLVTPTPDGAFYLFPNVKNFLGKRYGDRVMETSTDLCEYLLEVGHVATVPGDAFGIGDHIRLSYAASEDQIREAITRIKKALQNLES
ncbi:MAG: aminotransferase class I/II-fold pyridoxal phosphate-dependent enzyme, partial [Bacteroidota bacterium]|nr:aminotransferase class I/II-fold pyridoxal phosphate-dependent enzyme [Bacteroidota bacterium]MDX5506432.1 aminotransferase class I/II-fold pyridoxal phosphate-dependent enzyme [Bacteroidota bacterium]